jgi:hypothetical protein
MVLTGGETNFYRFMAALARPLECVARIACCVKKTEHAIRNPQPSNKLKLELRTGEQFLPGQRNIA